MHSENNKKIVGFIGDKNTGKTLAANILEKKGFYKISISSKVKEFVGFINGKNRTDDEILRTVRNRGYLINKKYWINLVLSSIPSNIDKVVIDDLEENDIDNKAMDVYQVYRKNVSENKLPNIKMLINNDLRDFIKKIESLF